MGQSALSYVYEVMEQLEKALIDVRDEDKIKSVQVNDKSVYIAFLSIGNEQQRAKVLKEMAPTLEKLADAFRKKVVQLVRKSQLNPQWIKLDIVSDVTETPFQELELTIKKHVKTIFGMELHSTLNGSWRL